jgi:hypothetical protein
MRERDRQDRNAFMREYAAEEQAKEEARLAPIKAADAELSKTAGKLRAAERDAALNGRDDLALSLLSEPMKTIKLHTEDEVAAQNEHAAHAFMRETPDYYRSDANANAITGYCTSHGIIIADAATYANVYRRLDSLGLMEHAPAHQPEPVIEQQPAPVQTEFEGVDDSGRLKLYSKAEVDRLSADEYKRYFRLPTKAYVEYRENEARW